MSTGFCLLTDFCHNNKNRFFSINNGNLENARLAQICTNTVDNSLHPEERDFTSNRWSSWECNMFWFPWVSLYKHTARRLSWIKVAYFVRSNHEIYYIYQDENSWKLTKIQDLKDPVRWLMQEGGTSTNPHVDFHQLQTDSKFFTYVTKTRVNLNTYSRKPGNYMAPLFLRLIS